MSELPKTYADFSNSELAEGIDDIPRVRELARRLEQAEAALAEWDRTIELLWAVIGSVTAHNRVFGDHIAAAMKKYDLRARAEEGSRDE